MGGGGFSMEPENPLLDAYVLSHARTRRPRVCFLGTAGGDAPTYAASFFRAFARHHDAVPVDLPLFDRQVRDLRSFLLAQDVVYVGGGNTANLLAVWHVHGLPAILREALDGGAVLCGISAGMNCWFQASTTDSFGPLFRRLVEEGALPPGYAADDGAALRFDAGGTLVEAVASRPDARAYFVRPGEEAPLPVRALGPA